MDLEEIRRNIDLIDFMILRLLNKRAELALLTGRVKKEIEDKKREREVIERVKKNSTRFLLRPEFIERLYFEMIKESKRLQRAGYRLIAFQGEHGSYSEIASVMWNDKLIPMPCSRFEELFEGVERSLYDYGIVPVENSLGGRIGRVNELLLQTELKVIGAIVIPIRHCLLALPGTELSEIRVVFSHPQALFQCKSFIEMNSLQAIKYYDTAGAARMLMEENIKGAGVIANRLCASIYGLEVIKENIADHEDNMTRFFVLAKESDRDDGNMCSVIFFTEHRPGTLLQVLEIFADAGINLTRIDSIPKGHNNYAFFLDFIGSYRDAEVLNALDLVKRITKGFKFLGCYKERRVVL